MKIDVKMVHDESGTWYRLVPNRIDYCCTDMEDAFDKTVIGFSNHYEYPQDNDDVNIYQTSCYYEGAGYTNFKINYCPFCGAKIIIE